MGLVFNTSQALSEIARSAQPLSFIDQAEYDPLLAAIGDARLVLIGEASHGTHDFYRERARITRRLIEEKGFNAVAVEADWPDAYRVHRFVTGQPDEPQSAQAVDALSGFRRFPAWMWRNMDVLAFVEWLREHNLRRSAPVGFFGLDLYSLYSSAQEVLRYLDRNDQEAAARARFRYGCFDQFGEDSQAYGYAAGFELSESCEQAVIDQLLEMRREAGAALFGDGKRVEELFSARENAQVVVDSERYYRMMFGGRVSSWNLRDTHMAETLNRLVEHLGPDSKIVVWAHNSHLGDARATQMGRSGELNLGQLVRERYPDSSFLIGFTTYSGEVTAASNWDEPAQRKVVRRALPNSIESLFHETGLGNFLLPLREEPIRKALSKPLLERAIGVIYRPDTERVSHYFEANVPKQFDAVIHIDRTLALIPLETTVRWQEGEEVPETFPSAV